MKLNSPFEPAYRRRYIQIAFLLASGVIASAQVGKAVISVPLIRSEFSAGVGGAGLVVGMFALLGASSGVFAGAAVRRMGAVRALTSGMAAIAFGNFLGAGAPNEFVLLAARAVEGAGFFATILAIPSMLSVIAGARDRDFVMATWSAYMPAGITFMLFVGPIVDVIGWRELWLVNGLAAATMALFAPAIAPRVPALESVPSRKFMTDIAAVLQEPRCMMIAATFFLCSCQIFSLIFALPLLLAENGGGEARPLCAAVLAVSTAGHIAGGLLLRAGGRIWAHIAAAFVVFATATFILYSGQPSRGEIVFLAMLALGVGGLAPSALYAAAPRVAPGVSRFPATIGLLQQASNLGQFTGPALLGFWAQTFEWTSAAVLTTPAALIGLAVALSIRRELGADRPSAKPASVTAGSRR